MKVIEIRENGSKRVHTVNEEKSRTDQQWKKDTDVNNIMDSYLKRGELPLFAKRANVQGQYADVSEIPDLLGAYEQVQAAETAMSQLPAQVRAKFKNNPHELVEFLKDKKNLEESIELGLRERKEVDTPKSPSTTTTTKAKTKEKPVTKNDD